MQGAMMNQLYPAEGGGGGFSLPFFSRNNLIPIGPTTP
jgi:hypothetical protein